MRRSALRPIRAWRDERDYRRRYVDDFGKPGWTISFFRAWLWRFLP